MSHSKVLILDYGSQFTQLITRRIRELNVYSKIHPHTFPIEKIQADTSIKAIILSGGPNSVYDDGAPGIDPRLLELGIPILGICYGLQIMIQSLGGTVEASAKREYGRAHLRRNSDIEIAKKLFYNILDESTIWMSHGDHVTQLPDGFECIGTTDNCPISAVADSKRNLYGLQFHPEVHHSDQGKQMIANFLFRIAGITADWTTADFVAEKVSEIRTQVGSSGVLCGLSGGVDSSVAAALIHQAVGKQLHCIFVDHGLLRHNEREEVEQAFRSHFQVNLTTVDASQYFLEKLKHVEDPERKRKIIGEAFVRIFEQSQHYLGTNPELLVVSAEGEFSSPHGQLQFSENLPFEFLAQGTLYPDVIESVSPHGKVGSSHTIKSHHNVGGLPEDMNFQLVEPFRELFKDEVRRVGTELGVPAEIVTRHPFPGPGLAIRIIGEVTAEKLEILRKADHIFTSELRSTSTSQWITDGSKKNYIIFDFDGVLVDSEDAIIESLQSLPEFASRGFSDIKRWYAELNTQWRVKKFKTDPQEVGRQTKQIGFKIFTDFVDYIGKIPNAQMAIVSSGSHTHVDESAQKMGLDFTHVLCFEDGLSKTEKIQKVLDDWGVSADEVIFFTDMLADVYDVQNILPLSNIFGCTWGTHDRQTLRTLLPSDQILETFSDILNVVNHSPVSLYNQTWQAFAVLTNVKSVGVMGDGRTYENLIGLRAVTAMDGMTADWAHLPYDFLAKVSNRIINEVRGVNRVAYDISSKPPATIEWE